MKRKKTKKLDINKITISNLGERITDLDMVRGGDETDICPNNAHASLITEYVPACRGGC